MATAPLEAVCKICGETSVQEFCFAKHSFDIRRCAGCGVGWTAIDDSMDIASIYSRDFFEGGVENGYSHYSQSEPILRHEFRRVLRDLAAIRKLEGELLEVGSAYGFFLLEAQQYFDSLGVELSHDAVEFARARGVNCIQGVVSDDLLQQRGPFDVAVMLDVIEHLANPAEVLSTLHAHMHAGGHLVITTGDWDSWYSRFSRQQWRLMTPPHHLFFSPGLAFAAFWRKRVLMWFACQSLQNSYR